MSQPSTANPSPNRRLRKPERLLQRREFLRVQGEGQKVVTPHFLWFASPSALGRLRFGVTVSKRVGAAVVRNRVKRLLREAFRHGKDLFGGTLDLVAIARSESATVSLPQVQRELADAARRLRPASRSESRASPCTRQGGRII
jgi:ribonuclease P protein component